jgi:hypothetical protein
LVAPNLPEGAADPGDNGVSRRHLEHALAEVAAEVRVDGEFASKYTVAFRVSVTHPMLVLVVGLLVVAPQRLDDFREQRPQQSQSQLKHYSGFQLRHLHWAGRSKCDDKANESLIH